MSVTRESISRLRAALPKGQPLPEDIWARRHRAIVILVWAHAVGLAIFGAARGHGLAHSMIEGSVVAVAALIAGIPSLNRSLRALVATFGLLTASAILVHFSGGTIEAHFHFFVMISIITLYQNWTVFLLAIAYVVVQHGAIGIIDPASVYNHPAAVANPWKWAAIHGTFVLAASVASIVIWKMNEELRAKVEASYRESQEAKEAILAITKSISHRAPLQEVIQQITEGARRLMGTTGEAAALMLVEPNDPSLISMACASGLRDETVAAAQKLSIDKGVAGRAIRENRLAVIVDYERDGEGQPLLRKAGIRIAMAAPVCEDDRVVGALIVGSFDADRVYSEAEQETLLTFAEHVSLALIDATMVQKMREAQEAKDLFLALVSHELKTPLTVIKGVLLTIQHRGQSLGSDLHDELITSATTRADDLRRLIDRLLEGAKGELVGEKEDSYLPELVTTAASGFEQTRRLVVGTVPPIWGRLDGSRVSEVLGILFENAISHSSQDSEISLDAFVVNDEVGFRVKNAGSLPEDLSGLFHPFQRGSKARSSGVGLGLYIAQRAAEAMGGKIEAASDNGTVTFTFTLPYEPAEEPALSRISV